MELQRGDIPSMDNFYNSTNWEKIKNKEKKIALSNLNSSSFQDNYAEIENSFTSLTGEKIDNFKHNNMERFISKNVTQNTNIDNFIGNSDKSINKLYNNKKEHEPFFQPQGGMDLIYGSQFQSPIIKDRVSSSITNISNNISPIASIRVGPGLNNGFNGEGTGGFHDYNTSIYSMPKNMNELRTKTNQKEKTFDIDYQAPQIKTFQRGIVKSIDKNRPEKVYYTNENNWFKTTGANLKQSNRAIENIKATKTLILLL